MITYTTTHEGQTKVRKSKAHTTPRYTHAMWAKWTGPKTPANSAGWVPPDRDGAWHCRSIATHTSAAYEADRYRKAGYEVALVPVTAS